MEAPYLFIKPPCKRVILADSTFSKRKTRDNMWQWRYKQTWWNGVAWRKDDNQYIACKGSDKVWNEKKKCKHGYLNVNQSQLPKRCTSHHIVLSIRQHDRWQKWEKWEIQVFMNTHALVIPSKKFQIKRNDETSKNRRRKSKRENMFNG